MATHPSPERIFAMLNSYQVTATLDTAIELDVFTRIAAGAHTAAALAQAGAGTERGLRVICDALVIFGLLELTEGQYRLAPDAALFLDRKSPAYLGSASGFLNSPDNVEGFRHLTEIVKNGSLPRAANHGMRDEPALWVNFARNMGAMQRLPAKSLAEVLLGDFGGPCKVLDIAAGHGLFGIAMAQRNPQAKVYALDMPEVLHVAHENAQAAGVADRWHGLPGSAFDADWGAAYDWVLLTGFLHHFSPAECVSLLQRAHAALAPRGRAAIVDFVVDDDQLAPPACVLFRLIMLTSTSEGSAYTYGQYDAMAKKAGFAQTSLHPMGPMPTRIVVAAKS